MHAQGSPSHLEINALIALFATERYAEAVSCAQQLTSRFPAHPFGWKVLAAALKQLGRDAEAVMPAQKAVALAPENAEAQNNLAAIFRDVGRVDEALACVRCALKVRPDFAEAHLNLGNILTDAEKLDEAEASYRRSLELRPDYAIAHNSLGHVLTKLGRYQEAVASCRRAIDRQSNYVPAHINLGSALHDLGQLEDAVASYRRALELAGDNVEAHNNLGAVLRDLGRPNDAMASCRRALELSPNYVLAHINLGHALQDLGRLDEAVASYRRALELKPDSVDAWDNLLFTQLYRGKDAAGGLAQEARSYGAMVAGKARRYRDWPNRVDPDRPLRVGLVSGDLGSHPVGFFLESMLPAVVKSCGARLHFFGYPSHLRTGAVTERIKACCQGWCPAVGLSDERLAQKVREDAIDILIDLSGHTAYNRLPVFAWKPAPVQATWLGYLATTGVSAIDYLIADPWTLPESEAGNFTEKIWRLPETYLCFRPEVDLPVAAPPALVNGYVTFGCFNNLAKVNEEVVALWAKLLREVPGSRLFLKTGQLRQPSLQDEFRRRFATAGIDPARLILEGPAPRAELLASYNRVDIALDPFPYPGITSTVESLWMGVPVLTLKGESFLSRQGVGLLTNAGLPEWIAADAADYVAKAIAYAGDRESLSGLRRDLRRRLLASPLMDAPRFAAHFETALRTLWSRWCRAPSGN
jgi:predicted O-linked N-acetylglucosamine transferase (SPINDLY family)